MKLLYLLPHFDESKNSFSKLLVPILEQLIKRNIPFEIWSGNRNYLGQYHAFHKPKLFYIHKYEFLTFLWNLLFGTVAAWLWKRSNSDGIVHNIGGGNSLYHDVITAHACHAQYLQVKRLYGESWRALLNPIHSMILLTEWINYVRKPTTISVSEYNTQGLARFHPRLRDSIYTIENATPSLPREPSAKVHEEFRILFASNNHGRKGLRPLLVAMSIAQKKSQNWILSIAGRDPFEESWKLEVERLGLKDCVRFIGHTNQLSALMAQSDIFCLPSKYESFGMVFLEAAMVECPSYGTEVGILASLYSDLQGPRLCQHPANPKELYLGLRYWAEHAEERIALGIKMAEQAKRYPIESMVARTLNIYQSKENATKFRTKPALES